MNTLHGHMSLESNSSSARQSNSSGQIFILVDRNLDTQRGKEKEKKRGKKEKGKKKERKREPQKFSMVALLKQFPVTTLKTQLLALTKIFSRNLMYIIVALQANSIAFVSHCFVLYHSCHKQNFFKLHPRHCQMFVDHSTHGSVLWTTWICDIWKDTKPIKPMHFYPIDASSI